MKHSETSRRHLLPQVCLLAAKAAAAAAAASTAAAVVAKLAAGVGGGAAVAGSARLLRGDSLQSLVEVLAILALRWRSGSRR